ncbi:LysR family transcriptional regulator [Ruegeria arenilitoris]|uniref:LysR family transcriptional regulator n=1 Tax=Ruegeria arenilitoris TaxID=1173585 RepID=UPI00147AA393|nr:LysR family transcriptional regulator [Ruegeria arenilitoris]
MNVNALDLNLLKAFDALYQERHVGNAGARIGLAQPSMSNALNRLRAQFDDPLFQRSPGGMMPTERAEELAPQIRLALDLVSNMLTPAEFDPMKCGDRVTIAAADLVVLTLAPLVMKHLEHAAPNLRVSFAPLDKARSLAELENEAIDLVIGHFGHLPARLHRRPILKDGFVCIARTDHPYVGPDLTLDMFLKARHALMTLSHDFEGEVDRILKRQGLRRNVVMTCAQFTALPLVIASSDLIATVPASLGDIAQRAGCAVLPLPIEMPPWQSEMIWTQKSQASPLGRFLVEVLEQAVLPHRRP